jgi:hypothetical protein
MKRTKSAKHMRPSLTWLKVLLVGIAVLALLPQGGLTQKNPSPPFKVKLDFNRWHDTNELYADMKRLAAAFPKFVKTGSIGKTYDNRDVMLVTVNNPDTGPEMSKAAFYIESNIHGNEIQGGEICLYTVWYLMENYGRLEPITKLVNERVFYIVPTINPDGRQYFFDGAGGNTRSGHVPFDDDNDGLFDEDPPEDINGDGVVSQMRKYVPGQGTHRISALDPRMLEPVGLGEKGDYILLGNEGIDNDQDGRVNEDDLGGYDGNRNYPSDWQPNYMTTWADTTATATTRATGSPTTSRAGRWTIRPSSQRRGRRSSSGPPIPTSPDCRLTTTTAG